MKTILGIILLTLSLPAAAERLEFCVYDQFGNKFACYTMASLCQGMAESFGGYCIAMVRR